MDNAERIYKELCHERAAIWYISDKLGAKVMVKAPSPSIKAVVKGCKVEFLFGKDEKISPPIFHIGLRIYDDPINYQVLTCAQRFQYEHLAIAKIMHLGAVQIQFYNELNTCQAFGTLQLTEKDRHDVHASLGNPKKLHCGDFDARLTQSLDNFQFSLGFDYDYPNPPVRIGILIAEGRITDLQVVQNTYFDTGRKLDISLNEENEGEVLEKEIFLTLGSIFGNDIHHKPQVSHKGNLRELTDIIAYSEYGIFLIEAKALGIINASEGRTMERKVLGLQKQIKKAIKQLTGAARKIADSMPIYNKDGHEFLFNKTLLPHGIVLVSDLFPFGEWDELIGIMANAMIEHNIYIHIMDLKEFMRFIGYSKGDRNQFDYFLVQRIEHFVKNPSIGTLSEFRVRE
jgi:hypothetical protein